MGIEQRITCDCGCGKTRDATELAGSEAVHLVWYAKGGTEDLWFIKVEHAKKWIKDRQDAEPDPPAEGQ